MKTEIDNNKNQVIKELKRFGYQSQSFHILGDDMSYFFSPSGIPGVIAYVVHANVALGAGSSPAIQDTQLRH